MIDKTQPARAVVLRQGEGAVVMAFVAIPVIWTSLVVPMIYCDICLRSLSFALGTAALVGIAASVVREVVIGREDR